MRAISWRPHGPHIPASQDVSTPAGRTGHPRPQEPIMKTTVGATAALLVATALPLLGAGTAHAASDAVVRNGSCSANSSWTMKAKPDNGRLQVEAEIDSNRVGQTWHW